MQKQQNEKTESRWQKIGQHGELLNFDALHWAAAVDKKTKLMWAINPSKTVKFPNPRKITWDKAVLWVDYVNKKGWCGYHDWRIPNISALKTLRTKFEQSGLYLSEAVFNDINTEYYYWVWSCSPHNNSEHYKRVVIFRNEYHENGFDGYFKDNKLFVRLVRSTQ
jgi:hypothetical protein